MLMGYEVTNDLPLEPVDIETPLERMIAYIVSGKKLRPVPILRAGLGMVEGKLRLTPSVRVGNLGDVPRPRHARAGQLLLQDPPDPESRDFSVLDVMIAIATGGSAVAAVLR